MRTQSLVGSLALLFCLLSTQVCSIAFGAQVSESHPTLPPTGELVQVGAGPQTSPPPPPPPPPPLPPEYLPPPMTEEWQLEMSWEDWYWANLAQDYQNNRLTPEQEQILLNHVNQVISTNNSNIQLTVDNIAWMLSQMLDEDYWVSYQGHLYPSWALPSTGAPVLEIW